MNALADAETLFNQLNQQSISYTMDGRQYEAKLSAFNKDWKYN
jgi:hypothetical protein